MAENLTAPEDDRRKFPRLRRPVFFRMPSFFDRWSAVRDVGLGGCRIFTDQKLKIGSPLVLEILLPDGTTVESRAAVVWTSRLPEGGPAGYEVGLSFQRMSEGGSDRLKDYLDTPDPANVPSDESAPPEAKR